MSASQDRSSDASPVLGPSSSRIKERRKATGKGPASGGVRKSTRPQQSVNTHAVEALASMAEHFTTLRNLRFAARTSNAARLELRNFFLLPILQEIEGINGIPPSPEDTLPVFDEDEEEGPATIAPIALLISSNGNLVALEDQQDQEEEEGDGPATEIRLDGEVEELFLDEPVPEQNHNQATEKRDEAESSLLEALSRINLNRAEQEEDQTPTSSAGTILPEDTDETEDFVQASQEEEQRAEVERVLLEEECAREEARLAEEQRAEAEQQARLLAQKERASKIAQFRARLHAVTSKAEFIVAGRKHAREEDISAECRQVRQKTLFEVQQREQRKRLAERRQLARQQCLAKQRQSEKQTRLVKQEEQLIAEQRTQFAAQQLANSSLQQLVVEQGVVALQQQVVLPQLVDFSAPEPVSRALGFFPQLFHSQVQPLALNYHSRAHHQQEFERQYLADQRAIAYSLQFLAPKRAVQKHLLLEQITPVHNSIMRSQGVRVGERESPSKFSVLFYLTTSKIYETLTNQ